MADHFTPAPEEGFILDIDRNTQKLRKVMYHGVELPVDNFSVDQTWDNTTITLTCKGGWGFVRFVDSVADRTVDANPTRLLIDTPEETTQP